MTERVPTPVEFEEAQAAQAQADKDKIDRQSAALVQALLDTVLDAGVVKDYVAEIVMLTLGRGEDTALDDDTEFYNTYTLILMRALNETAASLFYPYPASGVKGVTAKEKSHERLIG